MLYIEYVFSAFVSTGTAFKYPCLFLVIFDTQMSGSVSHSDLPYTISRAPDEILFLSCWKTFLPEKQILTFDKIFSREPTSPQRFSIKILPKMICIMCCRNTKSASYIYLQIYFSWVEIFSWFVYSFCFLHILDFPCFQS